MPLVKVEILKGKSKEYKKGILDGIHNALIQEFKIPDEDRIQRLYELDEENFEFSTNKTKNITLIELTIFEGRSSEAKSRLYKSIVYNLNKNCNINGDDIIIVLQEPPMDNWGIKGGIQATKCNFDFNLKIK
ncbi:MAG: tautomerase family protein [Clostridium sp.]|uniref:tautomerase family protein n=1 Tax=Clostridium sp. TaxID=1506 RepID=UPI003F40B753